MDDADQDDEQPDDLAYEAWTVIANAPRGAWDDDTEWRRAAIRWRDRWHATLAAERRIATDGMPLPPRRVDST